MEEKSKGGTYDKGIDQTLHKKELNQGLKCCINKESRDRAQSKISRLL